MGDRRRRFALSDSAQQMVGGFLLAGPFVVTEEVWVLATDMTVLEALSTVLIVFTIGYAALYKADDERDPDREAEVAGVPSRFISLMVVSYGSVVILTLAFGVPGTFLPETYDAGEPTMATVTTTLKAISVGAVFSVVGAATADSVF
ncbi:DUF2391 family protein [Halorussus salilacus]|uniref:DUF2391 family protein n=1 Tax=Halorussus salilacus TaxID=2953750 RepID=UPI00209D9E4B|nr:DUF2391 family protein [Halorussus salilacus]USZ69469.1 DUF2391 family protein [Halorussus salilacus]